MQLPRVNSGVGTWGLHASRSAASTFAAPAATCLRFWDLGCGMWGWGCGVWGVGLRVWGLRCGVGVWSLGCGVWGVGSGAWGLEFGVWSWGLGCGVWGFGFGVLGFGCMVEGVWARVSSNYLAPARTQLAAITWRCLNTIICSPNPILCTL